MFRRLAVLFISLLAFGVIAAPTAFASREIITFKTNVPLEVPGKVIAPGSYTVVNLDTADNSGPVEIQNSKGEEVGDFLTVPVERDNAVSHTVVDLQKQANAPDRIEYFIPGGRADGYKFEIRGSSSKTN